MKKQDYTKNLHEKKLQGAELQQTVLTELLLDDLVRALDGGWYTKKEVNHKIKRLNNVRNEVARLKNLVYNLNCFTACKANLLENDLELDRVNDMIDSFNERKFLEEDLLADFPF